MDTRAGTVALQWIFVKQSTVWTMHNASSMAIPRIASAPMVILFTVMLEIITSTLCLFISSEGIHSGIYYKLSTAVLM